MNQQLATILEHPSVWRARDRRQQPGDRQSSHLPELDNMLGGGWPRAGLIELLGDQQGIGELQLLLPTLAHISQQDERWIVCIDPPFIPYAPALEQAGVRLDRLLWVRSQNPQDALWSMHQSLDADTASMVLSWNPQALQSAETRRLQLAATDNRCLGMLFRPMRMRRLHSGACLRIALEADHEGLQLEVLKRRDGWPMRPGRLNPEPHQPLAARTPSTPGEFTPVRPMASRRQRTLRQQTALRPA